MAREPQRDYQRIRQVNLFEDGLDLEPDTLPELWTSNEVRRAIAHLFARYNGRPIPVICSEDGGLLVGGWTGSKPTPLSVDSKGRMECRLRSIYGIYVDVYLSGGNSALNVSERRTRPTVGGHNAGTASDSKVTVFSLTNTGYTHTVMARVATNDAYIYFVDPDGGGDQGPFRLYAGEGWREFQVRCSGVKIQNETAGSNADYVIEHLDYPYV